MRLPLPGFITAAAAIGAAPMMDTVKATPDPQELEGRRRRRKVDVPAFDSGARLTRATRRGQHVEPIAVSAQRRLRYMNSYARQMAIIAEAMRDD